MNRTIHCFRLLALNKCLLQFFRILWCKNRCLHCFLHRSFFCCFLSCSCLFHSSSLLCCCSLCRSFLSCRSCFRFYRCFYFLCWFCFCLYFCFFLHLHLLHAGCCLYLLTRFITSSANAMYSFALRLLFLNSTTGSLLSWDHSMELSTRIKDSKR